MHRPVQQKGKRRMTNKHQEQQLTDENKMQRKNINPDFTMIQIRSLKPPGPVHDFFEFSRQRKQQWFNQVEYYTLHLLKAAELDSRCWKAIQGRITG